jgi:Uma2 family endonuclease
MPAQAQHRFSVQDYYRMAEAGVLGPGTRVELLEGRLIDMSPIGPLHGGIVKRLSRHFNLKSQGRWMVAVQDPLHLADDSEPEPDLMLLKPAADDYIRRHPQPEDVFLLIEVSDSTLEYDREEKLPAYGRAGVAEVWLVNTEDEVVEVYREPHFTGYASKTLIQAGGHARPAAFPDAMVDVAELLRR